MQLHLVDADETVASALREAFRNFSEVTVAQGDLLAVAQNTVVSPANAHGFMDGGIDAAFRKFFGAAVEGQVRDAIGRRPEGYLPIGASLVVPTENERIPYLIVAPTMLTPESVESQNCYRAMRAVLRVAAAQEEVGRAVYCPGLGTGVGQVRPTEAAREMAQAYADWMRAAANRTRFSPQVLTRKHFLTYHTPHGGDSPSRAGCLRSDQPSRTALHA